jgi:hypothetical protein
MLRRVRADVIRVTNQKGALAKRHGISRNLIKPIRCWAELDFSLHPSQSMSEK